MPVLGERLRGKRMCGSIGSSVARAVEVSVRAGEESHALADVGHVAEEVAHGTGEAVHPAHWGRFAALGGVAVAVAGVAACAPQTVPNPSFTGSGGGGFGSHYKKITGSEDVGNGAWTVILGRGYGQDLKINGSGDAR